MTLTEAITVARKTLARDDENVSEAERKAAYDVLAGFHSDSEKVVGHYYTEADEPKAD